MKPREPKNIFRKRCLRLFLYILTALPCLNAAAGAPPSNDNCANATSIAIPDGGYGMGTFKTANVDISSATVQTGETFAPAILVASQAQKSVWFKFTIGTTRSVKVTLTQPGVNIEAGDVGFTVYKTTTCLPTNTDISTKLTPIAVFGNTFHPCVEPGEYLIQVSGKNSANGLLSVQLDIAATGAMYDSPKDAQEFGTLTSPSNKAVDFDIECQSLEDANETCIINGKKQPYTRSTWHTFTTPAYFDYLGIALAKHDYNTGKDVVGFKIYKGDAKKSGTGSLTLVDGCDSLELNEYYMDYKTYTCNELDRNTTYTLQLFYKEDFNHKVRLALELAGSTPTKGPEPILSKIAKENQLGTLKADGNGEYTYFSDQLGCNARHSAHPCAYNQPAAGVVYNGKNYNISTFFTFSLASMSQIDMYVNGSSCGSNYLFRVYQQQPTANCTDLNSSKLVGEFVYRSELDCLPAGNYTVQVLGRDTVNTELTYYYYSYLGNNNPLCLRRDLGRAFQVTMLVKTLHERNLFGLAHKDAVDKINVSAGKMQPLQNGKTYQAVADTFGCENTALPDKDVCAPYTSSDIAVTKAMYREFVVGDSGMVTFTNQNSSWPYMGYRLFKGEAHSLAESQNAFKYPETFKGLAAHTECLYAGECGGRKVCVVPGTYTYATFGNQDKVGWADRPHIKFSTLETLHGSPEKAQDLGNIIDSLNSAQYVVTDIDRFSCRDNAVTIGGQQPCTINGKKATKAIYRQFYLSKASVISINSGHYSECGFTNGGYKILFYGKAKDGISGLKPVGGQWTCFQVAGSTTQCDALPAGWYTVVSYGAGPSYEQPMRDVNLNGYSSYVDETDFFAITVGKACETPKYNRPFKAAVDTTTKKPFLVEWKPRAGHTEAYPKTDTTYTLYTENFDCSVDTPFTYVTPCNTTVNRVAYYVFEVTKESFIQINTFNLWGAVYAQDVRKDSLAMKTATPVQSCLQSYGQIQLCKVQPGIYTLVLFADNSQLCRQVKPTIYVDQVGYSRFDHASKAYDFGLLPADSAWHNGKKGDINPLHKDRAPSHDIIYCTTGAQKNDPQDGNCYVVYNDRIYNRGVNNSLYTQSNVPTYHYISRRNLWYTVTIDQPGFVRIKVKNKTVGRNYNPFFAVYKSNVDGTLPFTEVVASGQVDSTYAQGLTFIVNNRPYSYCDGVYRDEVTFYRDPCTTSQDRYYIVVDNANSWPYGFPGVLPNSQFEVSLLLDSVSTVLPKFDHYAQAYNFGNIGAGKFKGETDNFSCATVAPSDPIYAVSSCARKTLWYKFTSTVTGNVRFRIKTNNKDYKYYYDAVQLFRQVIPGDSTKKGLEYEQAASTSYSDGSYWSQTCISKGTYYLMLTGCYQVNEDVYPEIEIIESAGDYCSAPLTAKITGAGNSEAKLIVDCHTIGTDYGEFGPKLTCPEGVSTAMYKSSWFRIDITGKDTLDVTAYIEETTNAGSSEIKYRMMTGDCGAMQEQSCVQDALTQNTYECLIPGQSYYIQVLTPLLKNGYPVTGDIKLKLLAKQHAEKCSPPPPCLANANFQTEFDCNKDSAVRFINYSTYGSSIQYTWDFGYNGKTSNEVSPSFFYPALTIDKTYKVRLITENMSCGKKDTAEADVFIPARPYVNLGEDIYECTVGATIKLDATSHTGTTYLWQNGTTAPTFEIKGTWTGRYSVKATYKNCSSSDTINVFINPLKKSETRNLVLCSQTVQLSNYKGYNEKHQWNTGETHYYINVQQPGIYWDEVNLNGCTFRDTFVVSTLEEARPLGNDTTVCLQGKSYTLNATVSGASSYRWQDGKSGAQYTATKAGIYWVDINLGSCTVRDSITITASTPPSPVVNGTLQFCAGDSVLLDAGSGYASYTWSNGATTQKIYASKGGAYQVTVTDSKGCSGTSPAVQVVSNNNPKPSISGNRPLCYGDSLTLNAGAGYASYLWSTGVTGQTIKVRTGGKMVLTVTDTKGCTGKDSVTITIGAPPVAEAKAAVICQGASYKLPSGRLVNTMGVYKDTLRTKSGCDSLITTTSLTVNAVQGTTRNAAICQGQTYTLPSGRVVSTGGTYTETLSSITGCDSIVTIHLSVNANINTTVNAAICAGESYKLPSGRTVSSAGTYTDRFGAASGCDSIVTTQLTVRPPLSSQQTVSLCPGQTFTLPSGAIVSQSGIYVNTLRSVTGCDSVVTTNLAVKTLAFQAVTATICDGASFRMPSGRMVNTAGNFSDTLRDRAGCDSLVTRLSLRITTIQYITTTASVCEGQPYALPWGGTATIAGIYRDTVRTTAGCDSIISSATLTTRPREPFGINASVREICIGERVQLTAFGGDNYQWMPADGMESNNGALASVKPTATTTYSAIVTNPVCEAIDTVQATVVVNPNPEVLVNKSNDVDCMIGISRLNATGGRTYLWSPAATLTNPRIQNPVASPTATTMYKVKVTSDKGCVAEESIQVKVDIDNARFELPNAFTPNGDGLNDCFGVKSWGTVSDLHLSIYSRWGELIYQSTDPSRCWDGTYKGQKLPTGVFIYQVTANTICGKVYRKGVVTVVR